MKAWNCMGRVSVAAAFTMALQIMAPQARAADPPRDESPSTGAVPAGAPQAGSPQAGTLQEVVVTAQFRKQNLQDTPIAITAVTGEMLEARSQLTIADVANQAPSVTLKPNAAAYGPSLTANIRGVGQFDFHPALEPGVGIYVDDVYYSTLTGSIVALLDIERVEVLRGPQGTLAGKNSIGGAIKLYSRRPTGDGSGYLSATYGIRDRMDLKGSIDLGITPKLSLRLAGITRSQDGYVDRLDYGCVNPGQAIPALRDAPNCVMSEQGEVGVNALRAQLRFVASDALEMNFIVDHTREKHEIAGSVLTFASYNGPGDINPFPTPIPYDSRFICGRFCNYATYDAAADGPLARSVIPGQVDYEGWGASGQIEWSLRDDLQLVSVTAYRKYDSLFSNEDDLSPLSHSMGGPNRLTFDSWSQELRLNGDAFGSQFHYTLGGFWMEQDIFYTSRQDLRYVPGAPLVFVSGDPVPAFTRAAFAHGAYDLTDRITFTGGIRYSEEGKDYTFRRRDRQGNLLPGQNALLDGQTGSYRGSRWDYRGNAQYRLTDNVNVYAQYSTGFKGGGVNPRPFAVQQVQPFGPETLTTWEAGLKSDLFEQRVRLNVAAFTSKYRDIQLLLNACPQFNPPGIPPTVAFPCGLPANVGTAEIKGLEVEANVRVARDLLVDMAVSYIDFEYTSIAPQAGGPTNPGGVQKGMISPYTPEWKGSLGAQYTFEFGALGAIVPRVDAAYQGKVWGTAINSDRTLIDGYTVANARLTWMNAARNLEAALELTNILDEYYYLTAFEVSAAAGLANAQPGRPREWGVTLKKRF